MTNAAILVPFVKLEDGHYLLFEKRAASISQGSEICFPGGEFDRSKDSTPEDTALRETSEELGIVQEAITLYGEIGTINVLRGIVVDCFVGSVDASCINCLHIDKKEVEKTFLLPVRHFMDYPPQQYCVQPVMFSVTRDAEGKEITHFPAKELELPEKYWHSWSGKKQTVLLYPTDEGPIWGVTAEIINEIVFRLMACRK